MWTLLQGRAGETVRVLAAVEATLIREAPEGEQVKVVGLLEPVDDELLTAPLSGRSCCCWEVVVEEKYVGGDGRWHPLLRRHEAVDFEVVDPSGSALVRAKLWGIELVLDYRSKTSFFRGPSMALLELLAENRIPTEELGEDRRIRAREGILEPGEKLTVCGLCRHTPETRPERDRGDYRHASTRVVLGSETSGVVVSDDPRAC